MSRPFYYSTPVSLAGLVACLIKSADWWTHTGDGMVYKPVIQKTYPSRRALA